MNKLITLLQAFGFLLVVFVVWLAFLVFTPFGWYQIFLVLVCVVAKWGMQLLRFLCRRHNRLGGYLILHRPHVLYHRLRSYTFTIWLANDQYVNALLFGREDHTISGRVGYLAYKGHLAAKAVEKVIDAIFHRAMGQARHCYWSIEWDEVRP